jgi:hypothetical protein
LLYFKKIFLLLIVTLSIITAHAQWPRFSLATDVSAQRNFKKEQKFWAAGHTTIANFHISAKDGIYIWFGYYSDGKFTNKLTADAKLLSTTPQQIGYNNKARMRFKHFSVGWKHYLKGVPDAETKWNMYGFAGFGLMLGSVTNTHSLIIDTAAYNLPVVSGRGSFRRLTLDIGLGAEYPLGSDFYLYGEGKALIPTTDYPSKYIFVNSKAPFVAMLAVGLRLLF